MTTNRDDGPKWKSEVMQHRRNHCEECDQAHALANLAEAHFLEVRADPTENTALFCLAFHHFLMRFNTHAQKRTMKLMMKARLEDLPTVFGFGERLIEDSSHDRA